MHGCRVLSTRQEHDRSLSATNPRNFSSVTLSVLPGAAHLDCIASRNSEGTWNKGVPDFGPPTEGYRRFVFPDGRGVYEGHWRGCKRHGQGMFTFANGDVYMGEFFSTRLCTVWSQSKQISDIAERAEMAGCRTTALSRQSSRSFPGRLA